MGAINHYAINHTTGQGRLQGFGLKTARILSLPYSNERSAAAEDTRRRTTNLLYAAAHPMSKRNMLFVLDDKVVNLRAVWVPGIPRPAHGCADQFLSVRIGGVPAGVRKIYVALEACRKIANSGLLCAMPGAAVVRKMNEDMKVVKESGVSCHVGAILSQIDDNNEEHPVGFFSRKLLPREQQYATVEKECLAIKLGVEAFKVYLLGRSFTILTDHRALEWLERLKGNNSRLTRWSLSLQPYSFTVKFRKGISNQNADALSRLFGEDGQAAKEGEGSVKD